MYTDLTSDILVKKWQGSNRGCIFASSLIEAQGWGFKRVQVKGSQGLQRFALGTELGPFYNTALRVEGDHPAGGDAGTPVS